MADQTKSLARTSKYSSCQDWASAIQAIQQPNMTPEIQRKIKEKARRQRSRGKKCKRAKVYQKAAFLSKNAWAQGNVKAIRSAPAVREEAVQQNKNQMMAIQSVYNSRQAWADDDDEAEDALDGQLDLLAVDQAQDDVQVDDGSMAQILTKLKKQPENDGEMASKFGLYEDFLKTVEDSRKATYDFWEDCKPDFVEASGNVVNQVERDLKKVDGEENLGFVWNEHRWFVYDMTVKADSNNDKLKGVLRKIETKLELLGADDDCPFCLESGKESVTLSCCHKACEECWSHWQELKGRNAFCPLCRQEDFLSDVMSL